jgi:DNA repair protein RadD
MKLRPYQDEAVQAVYDYYENNSGNILLCLPTGSGKSVIQAKLLQDIVTRWPNQRLLCLTHVKELVEQNHQKLLHYWPEAPAGVYCASLNARRAHDAITIASVQSVYKKAHVLGWRSLIFIDEAHLLGREESGMYRQLIKDMAAINPRIKIIGLTATPYRTSSGLLHVGEDAIFTDVAVDIPVKRLIDEGYLSTLITKSSLTQADLSQVKTVAGEFNRKQMEAAMDVDAITTAALDEIFSIAGNRKAWLFFCTGIKHAEHVRDAIRLRGIECETVHSKISQDERASILERFKSGKLQALTNANVLTTGFDAPNIDLLVLLRPTKSPGLYVQMIGRGTRLHPDKENCLILDFAGNVERFGPITHVRPPAYKKEYKAEKKDFWICGICRMANPNEEEICQECGTAKPYVEREMVTHEATASGGEILSDAPQTPFESVEVREITYDKHYKANSPVSMVVTYNGRYKEWICLEHEGFARAKAEGWWKRRAGTDAPDVQGALNHIRSAGILEPTRITVKHEDKYKRVVNYEFERSENSITGRQTTAAIFA